MYRLFVAVLMIAALLAPAARAEEMIGVFKYDGTLQCDAGKGITLDDMAKELSAAGIKIVNQRKAHDGYFRPALCGSSTGSVNVYEIARDDLARAKALGYAEFPPKK